MKSQVEIAIREYLEENPASRSRTIAEGIGYSQKSVVARIAVMSDVVIDRTTREGSANVCYYTLGKPRRKLSDFSDVSRMIVAWSSPPVDSL